MHDIHLILVGPNAVLCRAFQAAFAELPNAEVVHSSFEQLPAFDCMVSAANSFGLMDGGVDAAIIRFFGEGLERRVQQHILAEYLGEQPVGTSFIIATGHPHDPYLAHTPTMRVPMEIARTDNVYRAMWAMLRAVRHHNRQPEQPITRIACPGLGTGTGHVPLGEAARQMTLAYRHFLFPATAISWQMADARQLAVRYGGDMGLHIPPDTGM
jgi:O-acetyl-ADP-ribose deacetylase (regulator of RNase III)